MTSRRDFLRAGVAAAGAVAMSAPCVAAGGKAAKPGGMLFGLCAWSPEMLKLAKKLGYDFWESSVGNALDPDKDEEWWKRQRDTLLAAELPLRSCNGFIPGSYRLTGPQAKQEPALKYGEIALRRAEEVGVKTVVFGSGGARNVPGDFCGPRDKWPDLQKGVVQYEDFCRGLCRRCADLKSVQVVIEPLCPNESNIVNYVWQGLQICESVGSPRLAQLADLFHMMMGRESAESIVRAGARLRHCHIAEYASRMFPGHDPKLVERFKPYFAALKDIGYSGGVSCECGWGKELEKDMETALETMKELAS